MQTTIIIGTGLAGYTLAREFRKLDPNSKLIIITADDGHYYSKPQLSSALTTKKPLESFSNMPAETMRQQLNG